MSWTAGTTGSRSRSGEIWRERVVPVEGVPPDLVCTRVGEDQGSVLRPSFVTSSRRGDAARGGGRLLSP